jgi:LysM repeat protein
VPRRRRPIRFRTNREGGGLEAAETAARAEAEAAATDQATPEETTIPGAAEQASAEPVADPVAAEATPAEPATEPVPTEPVAYERVAYGPLSVEPLALRSDATATAPVTPATPVVRAPLEPVPSGVTQDLEATTAYPTPTVVRRKRRRWWLPLLAIVVVLVLAAAAGYGLAYFVASLANVTPPNVTLPPATATPAAPTPVPSTAAPTVSPSTPAASASVSPIPSQAIHIVQQGEYLIQIAARYGVTPQAIIEANHITNPNLIEPGQQLIIPPRP